MIYLVIWIHFIADFIFQTRRMADNKSKSLSWLTCHCCEYTVFLFVLGWQYAVINGAAHFVTDFITSKLSKNFYLKQNMKGFWITIGADQAIHMTCLIYTLRWADASFISRFF